MERVDSKFDRVLELPNTIVIMTTELVDNLWEARLNFVSPRNRRRASAFFDGLLEVTQKLEYAHRFSYEEMTGTQYWSSIRRFHKSWMEEPLTSRAKSQLIRKFNHTVALFRDIRRHGMRDPLDMVVTGNDRLLYRGNRRLVILKTLQVRYANVRNAIIYNSGSVK